MPNTDLKIISIVRNHGNKVVGNDLESVTIKVYAEGCINSSVDDAQTMFLPGSEGNFIVRPTALGILVRTVDQDVITSWWCATQATIESTGTGLECCDIIPILEGISAKVDVVIGGCRAVNLYRSNDAISVLIRKMRVVPRRTVFRSLKLINLAIARSERAY